MTDIYTSVVWTCDNSMDDALFWIFALANFYLEWRLIFHHKNVKLIYEEAVNIKNSLSAEFSEVMKPVLSSLWLAKA